MNLSMKWLKEFVDINADPHAFSEAITMSGSKVEGYEIEGADVSNIVVGKVLSIDKHPDADKLVVCSIDVAGERPLQIVTGASNLTVGDMVPVCLDGAVLPGGKKIKKGKLRAVSYTHLDVYKRQVKTFNPENFDAKAIVDLAVAAGQKYIVFTSKHHEGFSMFDTNIKGFEPYNIMDYGVYTGEDPILALSQAAKEAGLGFGVYYSIMDWKHPSQSDWGGTMLDKEGYLSDMKAQLRELIQVYGVDQLLSLIHI